MPDRMLVQQDAALQDQNRYIPDPFVEGHPRQRFLERVRDAAIDSPAYYRGLFLGAVSAARKKGSREAYEDLIWMLQSRSMLDEQVTASTLALLKEKDLSRFVDIWGLLLEILIWHGVLFDFDALREDRYYALLKAHDLPLLIRICISADQLGTAFVLVQEARELGLLNDYDFRPCLRLLRSYFWHGSLLQRVKNIQKILFLCGLAHATRTPS